MTRRDVRDERGSTIPLILGFFLIAMYMVAGAIALGQAFVQQRDLQDVCDGAATAAAASSADLDRGGLLGAGPALRFANLQRNVDAYLARDPSRQGVEVTAALSPDAQRLTLRCTQTRDLAFGALFDRGQVTHTATSTARSPLTR